MFDPHLPGDGSGLPAPQPMICWFWYETCGNEASGDEEVDGGDVDDGDDEEVDGDDAVDGNHLAWPEQFHGTSNRGWVPPRILWLELCVVDEDCNCEADLSRC